VKGYGRLMAFRCCECGSELEDVGMPGRMYTYRRGFELEIPSDIIIPTCSECGDELWTFELSDEIERVLGVEYRKMQAEILSECIERLRELYAFDPVNYIQEICGTDKIYATKVMNGEVEMPIAMVRLLQLMTDEPRLFLRCVERFIKKPQQEKHNAD
jgi:hypothetical protein